MLTRRTMEDMPIPSLAVMMREGRRKLGISQGQLAFELGVSLPTVENWERLDREHPRSSDPDWPRIYQMAVLFGWLDMEPSKAVDADVITLALSRV